MNYPQTFFFLKWYRQKKNLTVATRPTNSSRSNPFTNDLSIALKGENIHEASFTITNVLGLVIYKREDTNLSSNYTKMIDLSYLPNGIYFVQITADGENTVRGGEGVNLSK